MDRFSFAIYNLICQTCQCINFVSFDVDTMEGAGQRIFIAVIVGTLALQCWSQNSHSDNSKVFNQSIVYMVDTGRVD